MAYKIIFTEQYEKRATRFFRKHQDLLSQYQKVLKIMELNPDHPSLRLHALKGKLAGLHSVSINISCRITIEFIIKDETIIPVDVGSHDQVY